MTSTNVFENAHTVSITTFDVSDLPEEVLTAWDRWQEIERRHGYDAWCYGDVPLGDKQARTRRANKFFDAIEAAGLDAANVTARLSNSNRA